MPIIKYQDVTPEIGDKCFVADSADVIGKVELGGNSSIWYNCVVRGDVNYIKIGKGTNIQDGTIIHVASEKLGDLPTVIGDNVTIGHMALIHACTIESEAFIGMKACILDGAVVQSKAYVGAGAVVTPGKVVKTGELWAGVPAKKIRDLTEEDYATMKWNTEHYVHLAHSYL